MNAELTYTKRRKLTRWRKECEKNPVVQFKMAKITLWDQRWQFTW